MMKQLSLLAIILIWMNFSCKKNKIELHPVPFLTGKVWKMDTITINPPVTYNQLSPADQQSYNNALSLSRYTELTLHEDGTVTLGGDWDFGYREWRLINNDRDIEMRLMMGGTDTLFSWTANAQQFTYQLSFNPSFDCTFVYQ